MSGPSQAVLGYGSKLQRGDVASATNFVDVAEVRSLDGPKLSKDRKEVTHLQSPGGYKEYISGLKDGGDVTFTLNFIPSDTTQDEITGIIYDYDHDVRRYWRIVFATAPNKNATFLAEVMDLNPKTPVDDAMTMDITLKVTGAVSWS